MKFNKNMYQEFISPELIAKAVAAGAKFEDCTYYWLVDGLNNEPLELCYGKPERVQDYTHYLGTYSLTELLYKLPEWVWKKLDNGGMINYGGIKFFKDAPFYGWGFYPSKAKQEIECTPEELKAVEMISEDPLTPAANLWIYCLKNGFCSDWNIKDKRS